MPKRETSSPIWFRVVVLLAFHAHVWAGAAEQSEETLPTYTVGVELINYEPFYFNNQKGYQGFAREVLDLFQQQFNLRLRYIALPVEELKTRFYEGKLDLKFPADPDWQPAQYQQTTVYYSNPVVSYVDGICIKPSAVPREVKRMGKLRGFNNPVLNKETQRKDVKVIEYDSVEDLLQGLLSDHVDGVWGSMDVFRYKMRRFGDVNLSVDLNLPYKVGGYSLATIKYRDILLLFNRFLINNQEEILKLEAKWRIDALRQLRHAQIRREKQNSGAEKP